MTKVEKNVLIPINITIEDLAEIMSGKTVAFIYGKRIEVQLSLSKE